MDFDKTQSFIYIVDNGDGTMTQTVNVVEFNLFETHIVEMTLTEMMNGISQSYDTNLEFKDVTNDIAERSIIIPNSASDLPEGT